MVIAEAEEMQMIVTSAETHTHTHTVVKATNSRFKSENIPQHGDMITIC